MPGVYALLLQHADTLCAAAGFVLAVMVLVWLKKHFVTWAAYDARQKSLNAQLADHERRLADQGSQIAATERVASTIAAALANLPQREDLLTLEISLTEMRGSLREMGATMQGLKELVTRQEDQTKTLNKHLLGMSQ